jgi:26S proteasome regulatory subunit N6
MAPAESQRIQDAQKLAKTDPAKAEAEYKDIISKPPSVTSEAAVREYEIALVSLGELYRDQR